MSALPDPAELAPSRDPAAYGPRPLLSRGFWAMMIFAALCLAAGAALVVLGPRFFSARKSEAPQAASQSAAPASPAAAPAPVSYPPAAVSPPATPAASVPLETAAPERVAALEGRLQALESRQARQLDAAAMALAAAALSQAAAQPRPFLTELAAYQRLLPASADAQALVPLAAQGAPGRQALAAELADISAEISTAARTPARDASFIAQLAYAFSRVVSIRRVDAQAAGPDGVLARAQRLADQGDLEGAVTTLDSLPPSARGALGAWRERAQRRIAIDDHLAAMRAQAAATLAAAGAAPLAREAGA